MILCRLVTKLLMMHVPKRIAVNSSEHTRRVQLSPLCSGSLSSSRRDRVRGWWDSGLRTLTGELFRGPPRLTWAPKATRKSGV